MILNSKLKTLWQVTRKNEAESINLPILKMTSFTSHLFLAPVSKRPLQGLFWKGTSLPYHKHHNTFWMYRVVYLLHLVSFPCDVKICLLTKPSPRGIATRCLRGDFFSAPYRLEPRLIQTRTAWQPQVGHAALKFNFTQTVPAVQGKVHKDRSWHPSLLVSWWLWIIETFKFWFLGEKFQRDSATPLGPMACSQLGNQNYLLYGALQAWSPGEGNARGGRYISHGRRHDGWWRAWDVMSEALSFSAVWPWARLSSGLGLSSLIFKVGEMILILPASWGCCEQ